MYRIKQTLNIINHEQEGHNKMSDSNMLISHSQLNIEHTDRGVLKEGIAEAHACVCVSDEGNA